MSGGPHKVIAFQRAVVISSHDLCYHRDNKKTLLPGLRALASTDQGAVSLPAADTSVEVLLEKFGRDHAAVWRLIPCLRWTLLYGGGGGGSATKAPRGGEAAVPEMDAL